MSGSNQDPTTTVILTSVYFAIFVSSIVGNSVVLWVCYKERKRRTCLLKWFIANLAIADLTFTVLTVLDLISFLWTWVGGQVSCKLESFLIEVCYTVSIMTLTLINYQRCKAVVLPISARISVQESARQKLFAAWVISLVVGSPLLYAYRVENDSDRTFCVNTVLGDLGRQIYYGIHAVCFFFLPLLYMIYAQITIFLTLRSDIFPTQGPPMAFCRTAASNRNMHTHRKVAKTLAALTIAFVVCWGPFIVVRTLKYSNLIAGEGCVWKASQLLIFLNTVLDPMLYGIYGGSLKPIVLCLFKCRRSRPSTRVENMAMQTVARKKP